MRNRLQENQGITAGMVTSVILTAALTGQSEDRALTFLTTVGSCAIGVAVTWLLVREADRTSSLAALPISGDRKP